MNTEEILLKHKNGEINAEEANKLLAEIHSNVRLDDDSVSPHWTEDEMKQGFIEPTTEAPDIPEDIDMSCIPYMPNSVTRHTSKKGVYDVYRNELGIATKAVEVKF